MTNRRRMWQSVEVLTFPPGLAMEGGTTTMGVRQLQPRQIRLTCCTLLITKYCYWYQVIYHCTIWTLDGVVVESTRAEHGGNGIPKRQVLGKTKIIFGFVEGFPTMLKGEVAMDGNPYWYQEEGACHIN
ncbi:uncharacterized protein LOC130991248 [Salvia miltiorrhiza]|uniref:uncharacterized protein LOC130991248 n=1 Tax=Salvia miltiorrhiza TaxID=226208 RepID=UPI0025ABCB97|nr:uncharacterized protein LOC130991248 [Salvia miltiorrhiza]XP_057771342.1 uncharacterized protein LOC130991248 [Salvia miltiorrhiza]